MSDTLIKELDKAVSGDMQDRDLFVLNHHAELKSALANAAIVARLQAACEEWVDYFDDLERGCDPFDPLTRERRRIHGPRVERTRAALAVASAKGVQA